MYKCVFLHYSRYSFISAVDYLTVHEPQITVASVLDLTLYFVLAFGPGVRSLGLLITTRSKNTVGVKPFYRKHSYLETQHFYFLTRIVQ